MFDIGANVGLMSIIGAELVGKTGTVHSFEPQTSLVQLFHKSIKTNLYDQITIHSVALSDHKGKMTLQIPKKNYGKASLTRNFSNSDTIEVPVITLSEYFKDYQFSSIRLIKIDVEGYEKEVLKGALNLFQTITPEVIIFELNELTEETFWEKELIQMLYSIGYEFYEIPNAIFKVKLRKIDEDDNSMIKGNDIVALSKSANLSELYLRLNIK